MMDYPTFKDLAAFVRDWARLPAEQSIRPETQFERDLGITGDDGGELLQAVGKRFAVQLSTDEDGYREAFGLEKNEFLFNSEGFGFWELLPFVPKSTVRAFTVGELHGAMVATVRRLA